MKSLKLALAAAVALGAMAAAIQARAAEYHIAVIQSLTGPLGFVGVSVRDGAVVATEEINRKQLLGPGNTLKISIEDDATDRAQALTLVKRFANDSSVIAILGPTSSAMALVGAQAANDAKVPAIVTSNVIDIAKTGPYAFRLSQQTDLVMETLGAFAVDTLKVKSCTLIGANDSVAYAETTTMFENYLKEHGVTIQARETIKLTDSDFSAVSTKVAATKPECIFIGTTAPGGGGLITQLRQAGLPDSTKIVGMSSLTAQEFLNSGGKAVEGVYVIGDWAPGGSNEEGKAFDAAFQKKFNAPPGNYEAMGYNGMMIMANALKNAGPNPTRESMRAALAATKDLPIILGDGKLSYDENRGPHYGMNILIVKDGKFALVPKTGS